MKKYILCPGYVYSRNDGDRHFVSADRLARLYGVAMRDCLVMPQDRPGYRVPDGVIPLHPDPTGDYRRPE